MIRPLAINPDGSVQVRCEHCPAGEAKLPATALAYAKNIINGADDLTTIVLGCPACGATTYHPVTGDGSCRELVQEIHVRHAMRVGHKPRAQAVADVQERVKTLGGDGFPVHVRAVSDGRNP